MGGCRCYFRDCHVNNAKFPRMHFFRFPLKDSERYSKWRQYSQMEHMLQFSEVRCRNTSVCARHFRTECFMNYKMDRLIPSAVPTLMRLSPNHALDFELDVENGVLITLEEIKFKHLIPPVGFECPLSLINDKILREKLSKLKSKEYCTNPDSTYANAVPSVKCFEYDEVALEKPEKSLVDSVEIMETAQTTPLKRVRLRDIGEERPVTSASISNKKCRILNTTNCAPESESSIILTSRQIQLGNYDVDSVEIDFSDADQITTSHDLLHNDEHIFLTNDTFAKSNCEETDDIEFFEIQKIENSSDYELTSNDTDLTIVQLKTEGHEDPSINSEILKMHSQISELKKKNRDFELLQIKFSVLESENDELKKSCAENNDMRKKLLALNIENNNIKKTLQTYETLNEKSRENCKENKERKGDISSIELLKAELLSRNEEVKELKKLLCILKKNQTKETESSNSKSERTKLNHEINSLKLKLEIKESDFNDIESELKDVKSSLNKLKIENDTLMQQQKELQQLLNNVQDNAEAKENDFKSLKLDYDNLQQKHSILEQKCLNLHALQNQEATVSTSLHNTTTTTNTMATTPLVVNSLTKAQLFNGIKRYLSASMVSLLRMEMFGGSEREWKSDERQVAVDILRLGEMVYKYFTDEWRIRLPALRAVHTWLNESQQQITGDEDDL